jgi:hypothetical protein
LRADNRPQLRQTIKASGFCPRQHRLNTGEEYQRTLERLFIPCVRDGQPAAALKQFQRPDCQRSLVCDVNHAIPRLIIFSNLKLRQSRQTIKASGFCPRQQRLNTGEEDQRTLERLFIPCVRDGQQASALKQFQRSDYRRSLVCDVNHAIRWNAFYISIQFVIGR